MAVFVAEESFDVVFVRVLDAAPGAGVPRTEALSAREAAAAAAAFFCFLVGGFMLPLALVAAVESPAWEAVSTSVALRFFVCFLSVVGFSIVLVGVASAAFVTVAVLAAAPFFGLVVGVDSFVTMLDPASGLPVSIFTSSPFAARSARSFSSRFARCRSCFARRQSLL